MSSGSLAYGASADVRFGVNTASHPNWRAKSAWCGSISTPMTMLAPNARAIRITKSPMVPQPITTTGLPRRSVAWQAWTALPKGSWMAAISGRILFKLVGQRHLAGNLMYSAKQPSCDIPMILSFAQTWSSPLRHCKHIPQTMWLSADTISPFLTRVTSAPNSTTSPSNSCPTMRLSWWFVSKDPRIMSPKALRHQIPRSEPQNPAYCTRMITESRSSDVSALGHDPWPDQKNNASPHEFDQMSMRSWDQVMWSYILPSKCMCSSYQYQLRSPVIEP